MLRATGDYQRATTSMTSGPSAQTNVPAQWWSTINCQQRAYGEPTADCQRAASSRPPVLTFVCSLVVHNRLSTEGLFIMGQQQTIRALPLRGSLAPALACSLVLHLRLPTSGSWWANSGLSKGCHTGRHLFAVQKWQPLLIIIIIIPFIYVH